MPVRADVVQRKLATIREAVEQLRMAQGRITTDGLLRDLMLRWAVERGFQIAAEAVLDAGNPFWPASSRILPTSTRR